MSWFNTTKNVLIPTDGSPQSKRAFDYAVDLPEAEITLLTVLNPFDIDPLTPGYQSLIGRAGMPAYSGEWYEARKTAISESHDHLETEAADQDVPLTGVSRMGQPASQILRYADESDIDLVVMGSHGRTGVARALFGSVAEAVVRRSPAPVTVVR